jgi:hypothetical protein
LVAVLALALLLNAGPAVAQSAGLQIRVLAGEDAVNVIQQKTAVTPVVEVRDRNGLPVPGATVTFSIYGANLASFPGAVTTFSVVTDAVGQATAAAISPMNAGTFAIRVQAAFQGQSASVTLAQTNVLTAANAAAASAPTTQAVPIGGSGVSGKALGVIGAVAAGGGVLVATQVGGSDNTSPVTVAAPGVTARTIRLTGSFTATLVHHITFPEGGSPCTIDHAVRVDLTADLTLVADNVTATTFRASETDTAVGGTCGFTETPTNSSIATGPMSGPVSALSFRFARSLTQSPVTGATQVADTSHEFSGTYDGTALSGIYSFERKNSQTGPGAYRHESAGRMTLPVTLR